METFAFAARAKTNPIKPNFEPPSPNRPDDYDYAKQSQFAGCQNKLKCCYNKGLCQYTRSRTAPKQTQSNPISNPLLFTDNSSSFLASHQLHTPFFSKRAQTRMRFFKTSQNTRRTKKRWIFHPQAAIIQYRKLVSQRNDFCQGEFVWTITVTSRSSRSH